MKKNWRTFGPKEEVKLSPFMDDMMVYKENSFEYTKKLLELLKKVKKMKVKTLSRVWVFVTPWIIAHQAPPSMGFSRQGYQSGLPFPSLGDVPEPGFKPRTPALQADALTSKLLKETQSCRTQDQYTKINCISIDRQQRIRNWSWKI